MSARLLWVGGALLMLALTLLIVGRLLWAGTMIIQPTAAQLAVVYCTIGLGGRNG